MRNPHNSSDVPPIVPPSPETITAKPTKLGSVGFEGGPPVPSPIAGEHHRESLLSTSNPYAERMRTVFDQIEAPDYPAGMVSWLGMERPDLYSELTVQLPGTIHRLWSERAPLDQFEAMLARLANLHRHCCELYLQVSLR
jgi:hypothetical protein